MLGEEASPSPNSSLDLLPIPPLPVLCSLCALPISGAPISSPVLGTIPGRPGNQNLWISIMNLPRFGLHPAVICWVKKIGALKTSPIVVGVLEAGAGGGHLAALGHQDWPFLLLSSHLSISWVRSGVKQLHCCFSRLAVPGENQFTLILVILERSCPEWGTRGRDATGASCWDQWVSRARLLPAVEAFSTC